MCFHSNVDHLHKIILNNHSFEFFIRIKSFGSDDIRVIHSLIFLLVYFLFNNYCFIATMLATFYVKFELCRKIFDQLAHMNEMILCGGRHLKHNICPVE